MDKILKETINLIMDHKDMLIASKNTEIKEIPHVLLDKHRNNFFRLLSEMKIDQELYYPVLVINGLRVPSQKNDKTYLYIPSKSDINQLIARNK